MLGVIQTVNRWRYRRALWRAIIAATGNDDRRVKAPALSGYRVIKTFERMNGVKFDPFNTFHVEMVSLHGPTLIDLRSIQRAIDQARSLWKQHAKQPEPNGEAKRA